MKLTKDTIVVCPDYDEFSCDTVQALAERIIDTHGENAQTHYEVIIANKEPFCVVDDDFIINSIQNEVERIADDRSSDTGDETDFITELILANIEINYKAIMEKMPQFYYKDSSREARFYIELKDYL